MSFTCALCDKQIDADDTAFHLSGKCEFAKDLAVVLEHEAKRDGPIARILQEMALKSLGRPSKPICGKCNQPFNYIDIDFHLFGKCQEKGRT